MTSKHGHALTLTLVLVLLLVAGCMTVTDSRPVVASANAGQTIGSKRIAILPIKTQSSLAPDSVAGIRAEINRSLAASLKDKLPNASFLDTAAVADRMNQGGGLATFEQLMQTYENTGVLDRQKVSALGQLLQVDYLLMSRLKSERMDLLISRGVGGSLDLQFVDVKTAQVVWGGSGDWKRGGMLGFGGATDQEVGTGLVSRALDGLQ